MNKEELHILIKTIVEKATHRTLSDDDFEAELKDIGLDSLTVMVLLCEIVDKIDDGNFMTNADFGKIRTLGSLENFISEGLE